MISSLQRLTMVFLISVSLFTAAIADEVVSPNEFTSAEAPQNNRFPIFVDGGIRYQQVFDSGQFNFSGPTYITEIAFRGDSNPDTGGVLAPITINGLTLSLSTTQFGPDQLDNVFDQNLGSDNTVVFSGSQTFSSDGAINPDGTANFDFRFLLDTPFLYDPSAGSLLLDVLNTDVDGDDIGYFFDAADNIQGDSVSRVFSGEGDFNSRVGDSDSVGVVTQFVTVPEPGTCGLIVLLAFGLIRRQRA